jgi:hypothetical protein
VATSVAILSSLPSNIPTSSAQSPSITTSSTRLLSTPSSSAIPWPIRIQPPSASEVRNFRDLPKFPGDVGGGGGSRKSFDLPDLLNLPEAVVLSTSDGGGTREEVGPPETESPRFKLENVDL